MPISTIDHGVEALCGGEQWQVDDFDALASLVAVVMVGRAQLVAGILAGAESGPVVASVALKARLKSSLILEEGKDTWHRDGLLFETICWIVARKGSAPDEVLSDPHRRATNQGADSVKVVFDAGRVAAHRAYADRLGSPAPTLGRTFAELLNLVDAQLAFGVLKH